MNKASLVIGIAAAAALAGCMDPEWARKHPRDGQEPVAQARVQGVDEPAGGVETVPVRPVDVAVAPAIEVAAIDESPVPSADLSSATYPATPAISGLPPADVPATTIYVVKSGDTLSKISKRYNIKIDAIKKANGMTGDVVKIGQKLKLPGNVDVEDVKEEPAQAVAKTYTGPTKIYTAKSGDTLSGIAHATGSTWSEIRSLNNMNNDNIIAGRKYTVPDRKPAVKTAKTAPAKTVAPAAAAKDEAKKDETPKPAETQSAEEAAVAVEAVPPAPAEDAAPAPGYELYTVVEGDDLIGISIDKNVAPTDIKELNNLGPDGALTPGMQLRIPVANP